MVTTALALLVGSASIGTPPPAPNIDRPVEPPRDVTVPVAELVFPSRLTRERDAAFRKRIDALTDSWSHEPLTLVDRTTGRYLHETWEEPGPVVPRRRRITLFYSPAKGSKRAVRRLNLSAQRYPAGIGWRLAAHYTARHEDGQTHESLLLRYEHTRPNPGDPLSKFVFPDNSLSAGANRGERGHEFRLNVLVDGEGYQRDLVQAAHSAEAMRKLELRLCNELAEAAERDIAEERLTVVDWSTQRGGIPPHEGPYEPTDERVGPKLTDEIRNRLRAEVKGQLDARRLLWETDADALHAALRETFPDLVNLDSENAGEN